MVSFKSNKDNDEYIMIDVLTGIGVLLANRDKYLVSDDVFNEISDIYFTAFDREVRKELKWNDIGTIALRKDSLLGQYLINNADDVKIQNMDLYISYEKVVNALNIAMFENDCKISNKILPLFKEQISGIKDELETYCSRNVIEYILKNNDFKTYIEKYNGEYKPDEYIVYEEGEIFRKDLVNSKNKLKEKTSDKKDI